MGDPIFLLAINIAVPDHVAVLAWVRCMLEADDAYLEEWKHFIPRHLLVRYVATVVTSVRVGAKVH